MSAYPSAPHYGARHPSNGFYPSQGVRNNNGVSQYPFQASAQPSYTYDHDQSTPNGITPGSCTNEHSFNTNAQGIRPQGSEVNDTYPEPSNQHNPCLYPSESHQPVPYSYDNSLLTQSSIQASANPTTISGYQPSDLASENLQASVRNLEPHLRNSEDIIPAASELEDGEVDDQELDTFSKSPERNEMGQIFSRPQQPLENEISNVAVGKPTNGTAHALVEASSPSLPGNYHKRHPRLN